MTSFGSLTKNASKCPKCGSENLGAKYYTNEDATIKQTIYCQDCGRKIEYTGKNRYQAAKGALSLWETFVEVKKEEEKIVAEKPVKKEKKESKEEIKDSPKIALTKDKKELAKELSKLITNFEKNNPNEDCPCTLNDLMKLYGFSDDEISSYFDHPKSRKKFLKKPADILEALNNGISVYTKDKDGGIYKYTPVRKLDETQETLDIFEAIGLTKFCYILVK